jgi:hypothetical protein
MSPSSPDRTAVADALGLKLQMQEPPKEPVRPETPTNEERVEAVLRLADEYGSGAALRAFKARMSGPRLYVRGYKLGLSIMPSWMRTTGLVTTSPVRLQRGMVRVWVSTERFRHFYPDVPPLLIDRLLGDFNGRLLDGAGLDDLATTIESLLESA